MPIKPYTYQGDYLLFAAPNRGLETWQNAARAIVSARTSGFGCDAVRSFVGRRSDMMTTIRSLAYLPEKALGWLVLR